MGVLQQSQSRSLGLPDSRLVPVALAQAMAAVAQGRMRLPHIHATSVLLPHSPCFCVFLFEVKPSVYHDIDNYRAGVSSAIS